MAKREKGECKEAYKEQQKTNVASVVKLIYSLDTATLLRMVKGLKRELYT